MLCENCRNHFIFKYNSGLSENRVCLICGSVDHRGILFEGFRSVLNCLL